MPAPSSGNINQTVAPKKVQTKAPVPLTHPAQVSATVAVRIASVKAVRAQARLPGEVSGPGVAVGITVANRSSSTVDLGNAVVTLTDSRTDPAGMVSDPRAKPLSGRLAPRRQSSGVYVFTVPQNRRAPVTVTVTLTGSSPVVQFVGNVK